MVFYCNKLDEAIGVRLRRWFSTGRKGVPQGQAARFQTFPKHLHPVVITGMGRCTAVYFLYGTLYRCLFFVWHVVHVGDTGMHQYDEVCR